MNKNEVCNQTKEQIDQQIQEALNDSLLTQIQFAVQEFLGGPDKNEIIDSTYNAIQKHCQTSGAARN